MRVESEWLEFAVVGHTPKTDIVEVRSRSDGGVLGQIRWHGSWRHYCFFPAADCVWSDRCLLDLHEAVKMMNLEHDEEKRLAKEAAAAVVALGTKQ